MVEKTLSMYSGCSENQRLERITLSCQSDFLDVYVGQAGESEKGRNAVFFLLTEQTLFWLS